MSDLRAIAHSLQEFLQHVLQVAGVPAGAFDSRVQLLANPASLDPVCVAHMNEGGLVVAIKPGVRFCSAFGIVCDAGQLQLPVEFDGIAIAGRPRKLRTWHPTSSFKGDGEPVLRTANGQVVWHFAGYGRGGAILVGTDLIQDLLLYRQGDPAAVQGRPNGELWGIAGERPVYLFEKQILGLARANERQADFWAALTADLISEKSGIALEPILPQNAPGAVLITGDDDQAELEKYQEQLGLLAGTPVTYFLHPKTRHTPKTLLSMFGHLPIELGIHPDALDAPRSYGRLLREQCRWFERLTGKRPLSLRNHGFLNDGYWGHLNCWLDNGIQVSSNLPGFDGSALNGSLLPARIWTEGGLSGHWSVVTAIGDGVRYIDGGRPDSECAKCVFDLADRIRESGIPGLMILNLHPQNVRDTTRMHLAALEVIRSGFIAWTLKDCLSWFESRTQNALVHTVRSNDAWSRLSHLWRRFAA